MRCLLLIILSLMIFVVRTTRDRCYYSGDNLFKIEPSNATKENFFLIKTVLCGYEGFSSFSISNTTSDINVRFSHIYWRNDDNTAFEKIINSNNFSYFNNDVEIIPSSRRRKSFGYLREVHTQVPKKHLLKGSHFVIFRCHDSLKPIKIGNEYKIPSFTQRSVQLITEGIFFYIFIKKYRG